MTKETIKIALYLTNAATHFALADLHLREWKRIYEGRKP